MPIQGSSAVTQGIPFYITLQKAIIRKRDRKSGNNNKINARFSYFKDMNVNGPNQPPNNIGVQKASGARHFKY